MVEGAVVEDLELEEEVLEDQQDPEDQLEAKAAMVVEPVEEVLVGQEEAGDQVEAMEAQEELEEEVQVDQGEVED